MNKPTTIDVLIAGQGAAAFSAGLYSVRYQMKTVVVGEQFGGETAIGGLIEKLSRTTRYRWFRFNDEV